MSDIAPALARARANGSHSVRAPGKGSRQANETRPGRQCVCVRQKVPVAISHFSHFSHEILIRVRKVRNWPPAVRTQVVRFYTVRRNATRVRSVLMGEACVPPSGRRVSLHGGGSSCVQLLWSFVRGTSPASLVSSWDSARWARCSSRPQRERRRR